MAVIFTPGRLHGQVSVPGDKSVSHRALITGARCSEPLQISNINPGLDVAATRSALAALGVRIEQRDDLTIVHPGPLASPAGVLDCANSGSTARMMLGACAGADVSADFDGDASLRGRPMEPVAAQLRAFGARIDTTDGRLPMHLRGSPRVETRHFILLAPSAQVKSALLFAGIYSGVGVRIDGDRGSRDHTERLLSYLGAEIARDERSVDLSPSRLRGGALDVPGDFSSAAFFITAAAITPGSSVVVRDVGVNPTRVGLLAARQQMGAAVELRNSRTRCGEPIADVAVEHRPLVAVPIGAEMALRAIDEIPLLAVAAAFAAGTTTIAGIGALRSKESDRIAAIERLLGAVGIEMRTERHGIAILGGTPSAGSGVVQAQHDHRIVMAAAVLACAAGPLGVDDDASMNVSFPGFTSALERLKAA